jgi:hypothetical protein
MRHRDPHYDPPAKRSPAPISSRPVEGGGYEGYAHFALHFPIDPRTVSGVWCGRQTERQLWLYSGDHLALRRTYFKRFAQLVAAMDTWRAQGAVPAGA